MRELYKMARERGIICPIFHNDAFFAGLWADCVDIYALDLYPYINPNQDWKKDNFCFDTLDNVEDIRYFNPNTQKSFKNIETVTIFPLYKFIRNNKNIDKFYH